MLNGGKMIAKGTYGCVYKPALMCDGSELRGNGVTKLMREDDAHAEIKEQYSVDEIDTEFKYHLRTPTMCKVGEYDVETDYNLDECDLLPEDLHDDSWKDDYVLMQMEDGGISIYDYMHKTHPARGKSLADAKKFILGMKNLFEGLVDFEENQFVHFDIKSQNIVYKEETGRFNYIDFGLSTQRRDINDKFGFMLTAGYYALPFDIILTKYANYRLLKDADGEHLGDPTFIGYFKRIMNKTYNGGYMPIFDEKYIANSESLYKPTYESTEVLRKIHNEMKTNSRENVINEMHSKLDVFSLGVILIELFYYFTGKKYDISASQSELDVFFKDLHELIKNMTNPFFKERHSPDEAYGQFMELIHKYGVTGSVVPKSKTLQMLETSIKHAEQAHATQAHAAQAHAAQAHAIHVPTPETQKKEDSPRKTVEKSKPTKTRVKVTRKKLILVDSFSHSKKRSSTKGTRKRHSRKLDKELTVRNPLTGRWIKKDGRLAKKLGLA